MENASSSVPAVNQLEGVERAGLSRGRTSRLTVMDTLFNL